MTLLYVDGCPNWQLADRRLRQALTHAGRDDAEVEHRRVVTPQDAERERFQGSPTVLVDGEDPFADPGGHVGLSCRLYRTELGLAGVPTVDQLVEVLRR